MQVECLTGNHIALSGNQGEISAECAVDDSALVRCRWREQQSLKKERHDRLSRRSCCSSSWHSAG